MSFKEFLIETNEKKELIQKEGIGNYFKGVLAEKKEKQRLAQIENAKWTNISNGFSISEEYKKIRVNNNEIKFSDLLGAELIEDGTSISRTTGKNTTTGKSKKHIAPVKGLVGGVLFGPVGAIIGGTSGNTKTKSKTKVNETTQNIDYCTNLSIKITLNNINNPMIIYRLINSRTDKNGFFYKNSYEKAQRCISVIQVIINNNYKTLT